MPPDRMLPPHSSDFARMAAHAYPSNSAFLQRRLKKGRNPKDLYLLTLVLHTDHIFPE
jgi:hypothetical protein